MIFLKLSVESCHGRALIVQFSFDPRNAFAPSVVTLHEYLNPRLEEHCRLVCRWQIKLHEQGIVGVVCLEELAHGIVFEEIAVGHFLFQHILQSGLQLEWLGKPIVEGHVTAH